VRQRKPPRLTQVVAAAGSPATKSAVSETVEKISDFNVTVMAIPPR
jgi:hypothetical protein